MFPFYSLDIYYTLLSLQRQVKFSITPALSDQPTGQPQYPRKLPTRSENSSIEKKPQSRESYVVSMFLNIHGRRMYNDTLRWHQIVIKVLEIGIMFV